MSHRPRRRRMLILGLAFVGLWLGIGMPLGMDFMAEKELERSLLVWLPLDGNSRDYAPATNPVTLHGDVTITEEGALFDGDGDFLSLPHQPLHPSGTYAISLWLKLDGAAQTIGILEQQGKGGQGNHLHLQLRGGAPFLSYYAVNTLGEEKITSASGCTHIVVQHKEVNRDFHSQIWVNGRRDISKSNQDYIGTTGDFVIGKTKQWSNVPSSDWEGYIRDVRVYNRALSGFEIRALDKRPRSAPEEKSPQEG